MRLARAKRLIENSNLSLTDIGLECGFGSCSHFSRAFSSRFNVSPSSLRRDAHASESTKSGIARARSTVESGAAKVNLNPLVVAMNPIH